MSKTLDFNLVSKPKLSLVMQDEAKTHIDVSLPTEGLMEELQAQLPTLEPALASGNNVEAIGLCYDLAARLINCNYSGVVVTAEELRSKYKLDFVMLLLFFNAYLDFVNEIQNAKN